MDLTEAPVAAETANEFPVEAAADLSVDPSVSVSGSESLLVTASRPPSRVAFISQSAVADFNRTDVNATSSTYNQGVSPRDYLQQVSAWYFGHAT